MIQSTMNNLADRNSQQVTYTSKLTGCHVTQQAATSWLQRRYISVRIASAAQKQPKTKFPPATNTKVDHAAPAYKKITSNKSRWINGRRSLAAAHGTHSTLSDVRLRSAAGRPLSLRLTGCIASRFQLTEAPSDRCGFEWEESASSCMASMSAAEASNDQMLSCNAHQPGRHCLSSSSTHHLLTANGVHVKTCRLRPNHCSGEHHFQCLIDGRRYASETI